MLWQRTCRHELFSAAIPGTVTNVKKFHLRKVETLLASTSIDEVVVLGLLAQLKENKFFIEDPTGSVLVDLSKVQYHSGFFCEGCFVLIEGSFSDGVLKASGMGFPPIEPAASSRAYFGTSNTWGGRSKVLLKNSPRLLEIERANTDATIVFLADCWLDDPVVMQKLQTLFIGYNDMPPVAIIMMGPFIRNLKSPSQLKAKLQLLGEMISNNCPVLKKSTDLVLVPALDDPVAPVILPRVGLPESLCAPLKRLVPRTVLASNPCRLQYCTQQIVVCRADLVTKLCRNTINFPDAGKLEDHVSFVATITFHVRKIIISCDFVLQFARTLICQGTLAPLSQGIMPIYWDMDSSLALYPLPDLIVIGDPSKSFETEHQGCTVVNTVG